MNVDHKIKVSQDADHIAFETVDPASGRMVREVMQFKDAQVRAALIAAGWTPPGEVKIVAQIQSPSLAEVDSIVRKALSEMIPQAELAIELLRKVKDSVNMTPALWSEVCAFVAKVDRE